MHDYAAQSRAPKLCCVMCLLSAKLPMLKCAGDAVSSMYMVPAVGAGVGLRLGSSD